MQWKQIKTLFILCFLILDVYLAMLIFDKQEETEVALQDTTETSFREQLDSENITISADLPAGNFEDANIKLKQKRFSEDDLAFFDDLDDQTTKVINNKLILSQFDDPISISDDVDSDKLTEFMQDKAPLFNNYTFGGWNKDMNVLMFFQKQQDVPIYYNQNGIVLVYLDADNNMLFYTQTMLAKQGSADKEQSLIEPSKAVKKLFNSNKLKHGDDVSNVSMGYHTRYPLDEEQLFSPTWTVTVNDKDKFYVNAIENTIYPNDEVTFLTGAVTNTLEKMQMLDDGNDLKAYITSHLKNKLAMTKDSE